MVKERREMGASASSERNFFQSSLPDFPPPQLAVAARETPPPAPPPFRFDSTSETESTVSFLLKFQPFSSL